MKMRDIVIGIIVLAVLAGAVYYLRNRGGEESLSLPETTIEETEQQFEETFRLDVPDDVEKTQLEDVAGGNVTGLATRDFKSERFTHTVLADLPDPAPGTFYEGWLVMGDKFFSTGKMRLIKGGYLLEYESSTDYSDYDKVVITLEKVFDATPEEHILEGTFN